jgi:hypothetical protein
MRYVASTCGRQLAARARDGGQPVRVPSMVDELISPGSDQSAQYVPEQCRNVSLNPTIVHVTRVTG